MRMKCLLRFLVLISLYVSMYMDGLCQDSLLRKPDESLRKFENRVSKYQIQELSKGALLVRLNTRTQSVQALRDMGKKEMAQKIEDKQRALNLSIVKAFRERFTFCPVYFFYSDNSIQVKNKAFDKVAFLNDKLESDTSVKMIKPYFLIAEFGRIEQDTLKRSSYTYDAQAQNGQRHTHQYYGGTDMGFGALLVKSDKFVQLRKPFPFYVRTFDSLPIKRSYQKVVSTLSRNLNYFLNEVNKK